MRECDMSLNALVEKLETSAKSVIHWLENNYMKFNESKCKILIRGKKKVEVMITSVWSTNDFSITRDQV